MEIVIRIMAKMILWDNEAKLASLLPVLLGP